MTRTSGTTSTRSCQPPTALVCSLIAVVCLGAANSAQGQWYATADALFLDQLNGDQTVLSQQVTPPPPPPDIDPQSAALFTDSTNGSLEAGVEIAVGYYFDEGTAVELSYFGLQSWSESASVTDAMERLQSPFSDNWQVMGNGAVQLNDFFAAFQQGYNYAAQIHNAELNVRRQITAPLAFVAGVRFIHYGEKLNFFSVADAGPGSDVGMYNVNVDNNMLGLQVGGELNHPLTDRVDMAGKLKSGMFLNWVDHNTVLTNNNPDVLFAGSKADVGLGGVIDAALEFSIRHGAWRLFGGYRVLLLSGIATADGQFDFSINEDPAAVLDNVNHQGTAVLHGPFVGFIGEF